MSGSVISERLRLAVLRALADAGDERATEAVERGEVTLDPDVLNWESSRGRVSGHRVCLDVPEELLASIESSPATKDALHAAFAAALVALGDGGTLADLQLGRAAPRSRVETPYRGSSPRRR